MCVSVCVKICWSSVIIIIAMIWTLVWILVPCSLIGHVYYIYIYQVFMSWWPGKEAVYTYTPKLRKFICDLMLIQRLMGSSWHVQKQKSKVVGEIRWVCL